MLQSADASTRTVEFRRLSDSQCRISEGLYSISYQTSGETGAHGGDAVALVREGRLIGADGWGGKFEGTYRFDSTRRTYHFHIWLRVPPVGEAVTGACRDDQGALIEVEAELDPPDPLASAVARLDGQPVGLTLAYLGPLRG